MSVLRQQIHSIREFIWPTYQPEKHYMRGPGPACRRREINIIDVG